jgi:c-src tyrosine kinase
VYSVRSLCAHHTRCVLIIVQGHFGQVLRGVYRGETVAVKVLHTSSNERVTRDRQTFINEALLLQQYRHKHIVKFLGIAAIHEPMMIVMEYIERSFYMRHADDCVLVVTLGGSLHDYLKKNELRTVTLIHMCYDIGKGMAYLERSNVIHR